MPEHTQAHMAVLAAITAGMPDSSAATVATLLERYGAVAPYDATADAHDGLFYVRDIDGSRSLTRPFAWHQHQRHSVRVALAQDDACTPRDVWAAMPEPVETFECEDCNETTPLESDYGDSNRHEVFSGWDSSARRYRARVVCETCRENDYRWCAPVEEWHHTDTTIYAGDSEEYAPEQWADRNWHQSENGSWYADSGNMPENNRDDDDDEYGSDSDMYSYGTNVLRVHSWPGDVRRDELCFGVELEMEPDDDHTQSSLCDALGNRDGDGANYILCSDGSLDDGVEVITIPRTLAQHQQSDLWTDICRAAQTAGKSGKGTENCGLHVHINRKALTPLTVGKMLVFINSKKTQHLVTTVAQRTGQEWARRSPKKFSDGRNVDSMHYDALGLTSKGTCELRIFRGNLRKERVLKAIEFAHALVRFCQNTGMQDIENPKAFVTYIRTRKADYPNLVTFISESRGYGAAAADTACSNTTKEA